MRPRALLTAAVVFSLLACTGAVPTTEGSEDEAVEEDGPRKGRKGRKNRKRPGGDTPTGESPEEDDNAGRPQPDPSPSPSPSPAPAPSAPDGIEQVNSTTWNIDQDKKDQILDNPGKFAGASKKGRGYALKGIKSGSDAWHLGLRNGDIVKEVNGYSLASEAEAIAAYSQLQDAKKLRVKLKRGEGPRNHTYNVVK